MDIKQLPRMIDLSCVKADTTRADICSMVDMAKRHRFVCCFAMPCYTSFLIEQLREEADIMVGGAVGFPSGADLTDTKVETAKALCRMGCDEIDMVINISALKSRDFDLVKDDICRVRDTTADRTLKVILEVAYLSDDEIKQAAQIAVECGADYVKTGTGWAGKPTTVRHIQLLRSVVGTSAKIKAAGGVHTLDTMLKMADEGCSRFGIGVNSAAAILKEIGLAF